MQNTCKDVSALLQGAYVRLMAVPHSSPAEVAPEKPPPEALNPSHSSAGPPWGKVRVFAQQAAMRLTRCSLKPAPRRPCASTAMDPSMVLRWCKPPQIWHSALSH